MTPEQEERLSRSRQNGGHRRKVVVTEVEDMLCDERVAGRHALSNVRGTTRCTHCSKTWAELDEEMRNGRG